MLRNGVAGRAERKGIGAGALLRSQFFLVVAGVLAALVTATGLVSPRDILRVEDGRILATLAALVLSVELLRASGPLDAAVHRALRRFSRARSFTAALGQLRVSGGRRRGGLLACMRRCAI